MKTFALVCLLLALAAGLSGCRLRDRRNAQPTETPAVSQPAAVTEDGAVAVDASAEEQSAAAPEPTATQAPAPAAVSSGCGLARHSGTTVESMTSGGAQRSYRLHVPKGYNANQATPLVLNLHGYASDATEQERYSDMVAEADANGFITVAPEGTNSPQRWYIYGQLEQGYVDDFAFLRALVTQLSSQLCIDPARIYATGISNGAAMSSLSACQLNDLLAAVAPVAGSPYSDAYCRGKAPVPVIAFHGTEDKLVPFDGGKGGRLGLPVTPVRDNLLGWATHNGCNLTLKSQRIADDVVLEYYEGCSHGADVQLYVVEGGGHTWPGAGRDVRLLGDTTHSIDATALIWDFFAAHPKQ